MTWSLRESLFSQSVRLTPLGQTESRFQLRDGGRERYRGKGATEALYLYELSLAEGTDWYNRARRPLVVS